MKLLRRISYYLFDKETQINNEIDTLLSSRFTYVEDINILETLNNMFPLIESLRQLELRHSAYIDLYPVRHKIRDIVNRTQDVLNDWHMSYVTWHQTHKSISTESKQLLYRATHKNVHMDIQSFYPKSSVIFEDIENYLSWLEHTRTNWTYVHLD